MKWEKMTRRQRDAARDITEQLWKAGVTGCTVSQVAKYFDEAMSWDRGRMPLAELCEIAGWSCPAPEGSGDGIPEFCEATA